MKIGLCTPYKVDNYGTKLQAYAVQEKIRSMGYEVEVVNFDRRSDLRVSRLLRRYLNADYIKGKIKAKKDPRLENDAIRINLKIRKDAINCFDKSHYSLSPVIKGYDTLRKYGEECSAVVCGSDQIWLPGSINNPITTLEFAPQGCRRIAFAPSFGISEIPKGLKERYRVFLRRFDFLSTREIKGAEIINELIGKEVPVVLDPTLSVEKKQWDRLAEEGRNAISEPYMFCYFLGETERHRIESRRIADRLGLKLVTLPHFKNYVPSDDDLSDYQLYDVTPCDFVRLIKDAKFVCTDSFHATVFSILYHKKFMTFERFGVQDKRSANSRIYSFLGQLELLDHIWNDNTSIDKEDELPDYVFVENKLSSFRQKTDSYLNNAFDGIDKAEKRNVTFNPGNKADCCGCTACSSICPRECIKMEEDGYTGFHYPVLVKPDECIHCNQCNTVCPAKKQINISHAVSDAYYVKTTDEQVLNKSSSGGIFYPLAAKVIESGGYVCAAIFDDKFDVKHGIAHSKEELEAMIGSKYSESDLGDCFIRVKTLLDNQQSVLFCGTPCQVHGLKSFLRKDYSNLTTMDLLCYGIQSPTAWRSYKSFITKGRNEIKSINMRDKSSGWQNYSMHIEFKNGEKHIADKRTDLYSKTYSKGYYIRPYCYSCQLKAFPRKSDITVGDFWDIDKIIPEENNGRGAGLAFPQTEKGLAALNYLIGNKMVECRKIDMTSLRKVHPLYCLNAKKSRNSNKFMKMLRAEVGFDKIVYSCKENYVETVLRTIYRKIRH